MKAKLFLILVMVLATSFNLKADEITIVEVKRNITLADDDIVYKDFYLNTANNNSLKKNMVVNVKRKVDIKDTASKSVGDFETVVGQLKIIQVSEKVAVAREYKLISRDEEPMLEQIGMMVGDRVDLSGSFIDNNKLIYKKTSALIDIDAVENEKSKTEPKTATLPPAPTTVDNPVQNSIQTAMAPEPTTAIAPENKVENTESPRVPANNELPAQPPIAVPEI